jgi:hypothetical protein
MSYSYQEMLNGESFIDKKRVMYKDFLSGMNTHPHTEDQATFTDYFHKHLLVTGKVTLYS